MPKIVDHHERKQLIAEALLRVTSTGGMDAASLRDVAAEAGVSMGMLQHYFGSKDELLRFACECLLQRTRDAIIRQIMALDDPLSARARLRVILTAILPLDEERRAASRVWIAFLSRAVVEPDLAAYMRDTWIQGQANIAQEMRVAQLNGEIMFEVDPDRETTRALSLSDGLVSHVLMGHYTEEQALAAIDSYLDQLFIA